MGDVWMVVGKVTVKLLTKRKIVWADRIFAIFILKFEQSWIKLCYGRKTSKTFFQDDSSNRISFLYKARRL